MSSPSGVIIGAGLAGRTCARHLQNRGVECTILEASDAVGGRVRTDTVDGFRLDRGFQVLLTAYPETRRELDYGALDLKPFFDGAVVRCNGAFHRIADPFRHPFDAPRMLFSPVGTLGDKLRVARARQALTGASVSEIMARPEVTTLKALRDRWGFSEVMIDRFFRPFFGGIFFDRELQASSRMFEFIFKMFSEGQAVLPKEGMQAIPEQIASHLEPETVRFKTEVDRIDEDRVVLSSGESLTPESIVVATEAPEANRLVGDVTPVDARSTVCVYYAHSRVERGRQRTREQHQRAVRCGAVVFAGRSRPGFCRSCRRARSAGRRPRAGGSPTADRLVRDEGRGMGAP